YSVCSTRLSPLAPMAISPRRRSIVEVAPDDRAIAAAVTSSAANRNASTGRSMAALDLDFDDLTDPDVSDGLHDDRADQHRLPHPLVKQQAHVLGIDERQGDGERRWQRQQHVAGEAAVRGVDADLTADLEPLADHVGEVVENLRQGAARGRLVL